MNVAALLEEHFAPDSRNRRLLQYVLVGALGLGINQGVLFLATGVVGLSYVIGGTLSRVVSVLANYGINDAWTWGGRGDAGAREYVVRGVKYVLTRIVGIGIGLGALVLFVELLGLHYLIANVLAVGVGIVWGFGASERWVWRSNDAEPTRFERALLRAGGRVNRRLAPYGLDTDSLRRRTRGLRSPLAAASGPRRTDRDTDAVTAFDGGEVRRHVPRIDGYELRERLAGIDRATLAVFALAGALFVGFTIYTSLLYRGYQLTGADFGSYLHMFWTTVNGHGFLQQGKFRAGHPGGVYWGAHFSLTLLGFLPFFAVWQSPYALLVAKSFVLAASVPLLWFVAREHIESRRLAGLVVVSYAFNPFLWSAWAFDFQEQSLLPLLVFAGYLLYARGRRAAFLVLLTLAMFTNEFVIPVAFGFLLGLAASTFKDGGLSAPDRRTLLAGFGLVVAAHFVAGFVIGQFSTINGVPVRVLARPFQPLVDGSRVSLGGLIPVALMNPDVALQALTIDLRRKVVYLVAFSLPLLFVAYADEVTLGSLAPFVGFAWLVSSRGSYLMFRAHYPLYLLPFVYIGAVRAIGRWGHLLPAASDVRTPDVEIPWGATAKLAVAILLVNAGAFVVIGGGNMKPTQPKTDHHDVIDAGLAAIPQEASVVTQNDLYPHVARRPDASFIVTPYEFDRFEREIGPIAPEYVVYDTELRSHWVDQVLRSFDDRLGTEYGLYRYEDGFWVFKRGFEGTATAVTSDAEVTWVADATTFDARAFSTKAGARQAGYVVSRDGTAGQRIWYGPYAVLAPGTYTATFTMYATGTGDRPAATVDVAVGDSHRVVASRQVPSKPGLQQVTLQFTLDRPTAKVEFRGAHAAGGGLVGLDDVSVTRQSTGGEVNADVTAAATADVDTDTDTDADTGADAHADRAVPASHGAALSTRGGGPTADGTVPTAAPTVARTTDSTHSSRPILAVPADTETKS
jgi:uncharacterized membrane protein/putative flippase GtrA